jgi:hypothetical protein
MEIPTTGGQRTSNELVQRQPGLLTSYSQRSPYLAFALGTRSIVGVPECCKQKTKQTKYFFETRENTRKASGPPP